MWDVRQDKYPESDDTGSPISCQELGTCHKAHRPVPTLGLNQAAPRGALPLAPRPGLSYLQDVSEVTTLDLEKMETHLAGSGVITEALYTDLTRLAGTEADVIEACDGAPAPVASRFVTLPDIWFANDATLAVIHDAVSNGQESEIEDRIQSLVRLAEDGTISLDPELLQTLLDLTREDLEDGSSDLKLSDGLRIVGWTESGDPLYALGIHANDVQQDGLGDCYFVAALAGVAATDSDTIRDAITPNLDGTYTVRLYEEQDGEMVERFITVDTSFPDLEVYNNEKGTWRARTVAGAGDGELWPRLMEKAYADMLGDGDLVDGYRRINGGDGADALAAITGATSSTETDDLALWELEMLLANGTVLPASQKHKPGSGFMGFGREEGRFHVGAHEIQTRHQYWVDEIRDDGTIVVRNPWGYSTHNMEMTIDEFNDAFREVDYVETADVIVTPPPAPPPYSIPTPTAPAPPTGTTIPPPTPVPTPVPTPGPAPVPTTTTTTTVPYSVYGGSP